MGAGACHDEPVSGSAQSPRLIAGAGAIAAVVALVLPLGACGTAQKDEHPRMPLDVPVSQLAGPTVVSGYGIVQSIDLVPRELATLGIGRLGVMAGSASFLRQIAIDARPDRRVYRIALRMDDGTIRVFAQGREPDFHIDDRVRVVNGNIVQP